MAVDIASQVTLSLPSEIILSRIWDLNGFSYPLMAMISPV